MKRCGTRRNAKDHAKTSDSSALIPKAPRMSGGLYGVNELLLYYEKNNQNETKGNNLDS